MRRLRSRLAARGSARLLVATMTATLAALALGITVALAFWTTTDSAHSAAAVADSIGTGATPSTSVTTPNANSNSVATTFAQSVTAAGGVPIPAGDYTMKRFPAAGGSPVSVTVSCSGTATVTCTEATVPDGSWRYADTPTLGANWVGTASGKGPVVTVDTTAPAVTVTYPVAGNAYGANWSGTITGTSSDATSGVAGVTVAIEDTSSALWWNGASFAAASQTFVPVTSGTTSWSLTFPASRLTTGDSYSLVAAATDNVGNAGTSTAVAFSYNTTPPTLSSVNISGASPTHAGPLTWTVTFSEPVNNVAGGDFSIAKGSGITGTPTIGTVTGPGPTATWTVSVTTTGVTGANSNNTIGLNMTSAGTVADAAGNALSTGNIPFTGQTYTYDTTVPTVSSINRAGTSPTNAGPLTWTVTFSEPVTGVVGGDFALATSGTGGTAPTISNLTGSGTTYTVTATTAGTTGTNAGSIGLNLTAKGTIADAAGNGLGGTVPVTGQTYAYDTTAPTVSSINRAGTSPTNTGSLTWTVTFSESVTGLSTSNFALATSNTGGTAPAISNMSGSGGTYTVTVSTAGATGTNSGSIGLNLANNTAVLDLAANALATATFAGQAYTYDTTAPTLSSINIGGTSPTHAGPLTWTVTFSEPVTGLGTSNFALATGNTGGTAPTISSLSGSGATYTVTVSTTGTTGTNSGSIGLNLANNTGVTDLAGNGLVTASFTGQTYTYDTTAPTVSSINRAGTSPTNTGPLTWTVTFSEAVTGVVSGDFALATSGTGGTAPTLSNLAGSGTTYTVTATTTGTTGTNAGSIGLNLTAKGTIADAAGNGLGGTVPVAGQTYAYDTTAPTVSSINRAGTNPNNTGPLTWTVTFSESVTGVSSSNFALATSNTGGTAPTISNLSGSGATYTVTASTAGTTGTNSGSIGLNLANNAGVIDLAGNAMSTTTFAGQAYTFDTTAPTLSSINIGGTSPTHAGPLTWTVTFSEPVNNVVGADFSIAKGSGITGTPTIGTVTGPGPTATWTVSVTTTGVTGANSNNTIGLNMTSAGTVADAAGNALSTANIPFTGQTYTYDTTAPAAVSIASAPNPQDGKPDASDQITFTFSEQMSPGSILTGFTGPSTAVTVHFDTGNAGGCTNTSTNCLTITGSNLGQVDLGTSALVNNHGSAFDVAGTMAMTTNGSNQSVLTVTLTGSNTNTDTTARSWIWRPSTGASDLAGNAMSAASVTEAAAKENF